MDLSSSGPRMLWDPDATEVPMRPAMTFTMVTMRRIVLGGGCVVSIFDDQSDVVWLSLAIVR